MSNEDFGKWLKLSKQNLQLGPSFEGYLKELETMTNFETHNCYSEEDALNSGNEDLKRLVIEYEYNICKDCGGAEYDLNHQTCDEIKKEMEEGS